MRDAEYRPLDNAKVALKITLPGGDNLTIDAEPDGREAGMYSATYVTKQPGAYRVLATATAPDGSTVGAREAGWAAQPAADEFARLRAGPRVPEDDRLQDQRRSRRRRQSRLVRRQPLLQERPDHRAVDLPIVAPSPLFPDRDRLPGGRMGPAPRQRPGVNRTDQATSRHDDRLEFECHATTWIGQTDEAHCSRYRLCLAAAGAEDRPCVVIVVGASGTPEYAAQFRQSADRWQAAAKKAGAESIRIGLSDQAGVTDRDRLQSILAETAKAKAAAEPLWIVLIGHGTYDGREAKFNLRGPDMTDLELSEWLAPYKRPVVIINCASASGPFINRLSGSNRVVVTATKSGYEMNFARFGQYLAEAIADPHADLDKDGQVSLLEAFLTASSRVDEYYRTHSQLATEHALLDDNGDRLGTPPNWFRGVRATQRAKDGAALDGTRAHQLHLIPSDRERGIPAEIRRQRDQLELSIAALRDQKAKLGEDEYYLRLEKLMVELARLYREIKVPPVGLEPTAR